MSRKGDNSHCFSRGKRDTGIWKLLRTDTALLAHHKQTQLASDNTDKIRKYRESEKQRKQKQYIDICVNLSVIPIRRFLQHIDDSCVSLKDQLLSSKELKSVCLVLKENSNIRVVDLSGSKLQRRSCRYVCSLLRENQNITTMVLQNCSLNRNSLKLLEVALRNSQVTSLDLSGNAISDTDNRTVANLIVNCKKLKMLSLNSNCIEECGVKHLGSALGRSRNIEELDLSWNHIRRRGAIEISKGIQVNRSVQNLKLSWNGFGFEGSVALSEMLQANITLTKLDISSNRIYAPAMLELMKGLCQNKILTELDVSLNPITPMFTCVLLDGISKSPTMALRQLMMKGIVVNEDFTYILENIQAKRKFSVNYELELPVSGFNHEKMKREIEAPSAFNLNPLHLLHLLKEKYRAQDFFNKINKDQNEVVTPDELRLLFQEAGIPVTKLVVERIVDFMDTNNDGEIDMSEFLEGDRRITKISRGRTKGSYQKPSADEYMHRYSRSFRKGYIDPMTFRLTVDDSPNHFPKIESRGDSPLQ